MLAKVQDNLSMAALRSLQSEIGGEIRDGKLFPIGPHLSALLPLEPASDLQRRWHVVQTESQQEGKVETELLKIKLDAYNPKEARKVRVNTAHHRTVMRPMLTGYVFAGFDVSAKSDKWQDIPEMRGVIRLLMIEERPVPITDEVMARLRTREAERSDGLFHNIPETIKIGGIVRILEPFCFQGLFGKVVDLDLKKREISVEIDIFGRKSPLLLTPEQIEVM